MFYFGHCTNVQQNQALREKDEELKEQLLTQTAAHTQHLSEALQAQAEQLGTKWASQTEKKLIQLEMHYQNELVKAMARLRGINAMIDTVANAGGIIANYLHSHVY